MTTEQTLLYILGYIVAYVFIKWGRNKMEIKSDWGIVFFTALISCFSWLAICALFVVTLIVYGNQATLPKPPRWL